MSKIFPTKEEVTFVFSTRTWKRTRKRQKQNRKIQVNLVKIKLIATLVENIVIILRNVNIPKKRRRRSLSSIRKMERSLHSFLQSRKIILVERAHGTFSMKHATA